MRGSFGEGPLNTAVRGRAKPKILSLRYWSCPVSVATGGVGLIMLVRACFVEFVRS